MKPYKEKEYLKKHKKDKVDQKENQPNKEKESMIPFSKRNNVMKLTRLLKKVSMRKAATKLSAYEEYCCWNCQTDIFQDMKSTYKLGSMMKKLEEWVTQTFWYQFFFKLWLIMKQIRKYLNSSIIGI